MPLSLPEDLEPYIEEYDQLHSEGAYALELSRPVNLEAVWHRHNETKPPYWDRLVNASEIYYVGASGDLLARLEDHRDNDDSRRKSKRDTALTKVCSVRGLHTAWPTDSVEKAYELERDIARTLSRTRPDDYIHQR